MIIRRFNLTTLLPAVIVGLFFLYPSEDADLGWHLRYGEYFLTHGRILTQNIFSWTMPNYIWPNHSWGYDILAALIFHWGSFLGITLAGGLLIALSFWLVTRRLPPLAVGLAAFITLYFGQYLLNGGLRSQLISLLITMYVFVGVEALTQKRRLHLWEFPPLFLLWANLHGQHVMGLGLVWIYVVGHFLDRHSWLPLRTKLHLLIIAGLSTAVILINPFGLGLLTTTFAHLNSPALANIYEWMPWELYTPRMIMFLLYCGFLWYSIYRRRQPVTLAALLGLLVFNLFALRARRMIPFFILISLPLWTQLFINRFKSFTKLVGSKFIWLELVTVILLITLVLPPRKILTQTWDSYCRGSVLCSEPLVAYLNSHHLQGKILNSYRLGGHLIYRVPDLPVFIDGRMTVWTDSKGHSPFMDYLTLVHNFPGAKALLAAYNFDYIILHPEFELTNVLSQTLGWPIIYQDSTVRIYQNPRLIRPK